LKDWVHMTYLMEIVASLAIQQGDFEKGARLFGGAERHFNLLKNTLTPVERQRREQDLACLQEQLGAEVLQQCFFDGAGLTYQQINELLGAV
jgi:hypothetical protein